MSEDSTECPKSGISRITHTVLQMVERVGLLLVLVATLIAFGTEFWHIFAHNGGKVALADLLLMFIYLEVVAMVGIYFEHHRLPVRFVLYIAVVALARHIVIDMKALTWEDLISTSAAILLVVIAALVVRLKHPNLDSPDD